MCNLSCTSLNAGHASRGVSFWSSGLSGTKTRRGNASKTKQLLLVKPFPRSEFVDLLPESSGGDLRWLNELEEIVGQSKMICNTLSGFPDGLQRKLALVQEMG